MDRPKFLTNIDFSYPQLYLIRFKQKSTKNLSHLADVLALAMNYLIYIFFLRVLLHSGASA